MKPYPVYQQPVYGQPQQYCTPTQMYAPPPFAVNKGTSPAVAAGKTVNRMCLVVLLQTAAAVLFEIPLLALMMLAGVNPVVNSFAMQWLSAILVPFSTALPFFIYMLISKKSTTYFLRFKKIGFSTAVLCVLAGFAVCLSGNFPAIAVQSFLGNFGYEPTSALSGAIDSWDMFALELFTTAVLVPVMEEFAFRGVLLSALKKHGTGFAIITSAIIFALVHLDFSNVIFALIAGLVFGYLYAKTQNLWVTIAIHMLNNAVATVGTYADFLFGSRADFVNDMLVLAPLILGLVALVLLIAFKRSEIFSRSENPLDSQPLTAGQSAAAIVRAPLFWVVVAMMAAYTTTLFF